MEDNELEDLCEIRVKAGRSKGRTPNHNDGNQSNNQAHDELGGRVNLGPGQYDPVLNLTKK